MTESGWMWLFIGWYVFSSVVSGMPAPDSGSGLGYRWAYASLHLLAANFDKVAAEWRPK